jgi:PKD repeat protein
MKRTLIRAVLVAALALAAVALPGAAHAAPPLNDNFGAAVAIDPNSLPITVSVTTAEATTESFESSNFACYSAEKTVWYSMTPSTSGALRVDSAVSSFNDTILRLFKQTGNDSSGLSFLGCANPYYNGSNAVTVNVEAGSTYYIEAGDWFSGGGNLQLNVQTIPPPANDDFAHATAVTTLPFQHDVDTTAATVESSEPSLCTPPPSERTAWYAYSGSVTARVTVASAPTGIAVYTGSSINALTQLSCQYGYPVTIHVDAGTTYYFQIGTFAQYGGQLRFTLEVPPPPVANFSFYPGDPSTFETVQFCDNSFDPVQAGITEAWDFGDGSAGTGYCVFHRFGKDGDYNVQLTITTTDGRVASKSLAFPVRTHDVAITSLAVPSKGRVGKSSLISVGVSNLRYAETVQMQLYKSTPSGFQLVGTLSQSIPVTGKKKTIPFSFNYTFTGDDATVGKVTFQAVATIVNARDALPSDNTAISLPVTVTR